MAGRTEQELGTRLRRRIRREWAWTSSVLLLLTFLMGYFDNAPGLRQLDHTLYDGLIASVARQTPSTDIVLVAIDDASIGELGFWPWRRAYHADLLARLDQARAVGIDLLFSEHNPAYPLDDARLAQVLKAHGRVVLPLMAEPVHDTLTLPLPVLAHAAAALGHINIAPDADGVVRQFSPRMAVGPGYDHLSLKLMDIAGEHEAARRLRARGNDPLTMPWAGPPASFPIVPYNRVLDGSVPPSTFSDKFVLVGSWGSGLGDTFPTPVTHRGEAMAGVEVLANILSAGLADTWVSEPPRVATATLGLLPVFLACIALMRLSPQAAFLFTCGVVVTLMAATGAALGLALIWVSPVAPLIGLALAYPLWSWRSQHAALRHIDHELALLNDEQSMSGASGDDAPLASAPHDGLPPAARNGQSLMTRIGQLHSAMDQFRMARRQRDETLRFLSHDMRSPLTSILALTDTLRLQGNARPDPPTLEQVDRYALKTLALVDGFVDLSRAEAAALNYSAVDLSESLSNCCDDIWVRANQARISVQYDNLPRDAIVRADPALLERAWTNLLDNAVKYSPPGSTVHCAIHRARRWWEVRICDRGRGMDTEAARRIFEPFVRVDEQVAANPDGAGLGLAFVRTVIERHGGRLRVESQPGKGTCFFVRLPAEFTDAADDGPQSLSAMAGHQPRSCSGD